MLIIVIITVIVLWSLVYLFNETPFLFKESEKYSLSEDPVLLCPKAGAFSYTTPKKETMILFLHGYKATPHDWRKIAMAFKKKANIAAPLYPGHGTSEEEFQKTCFSQWYACARDVYVKYRKKYKRLYICGLSMGATIALGLAEEFSNDKKMLPNGIVAVSTPLFVNKIFKYSVLYDWRFYFTRFYSWIVPSFTHHIRNVDKDGSDWVGYDGRKFMKQIHSLKMGMARVRKGLSRVRVPLLVLHSKYDKTVPLENLYYIADQVSSKDIRTRIFDLTEWEHGRHVITLYDSTRDKVRKEIEKFIEELNK
ncbi:MAG: alpha/beta fold hydrolase [Spirochaetes bacterium]|nr:alpha/beta fold hydrolase [Spirochaetota bacterium]